MQRTCNKLNFCHGAMKGIAPYYLLARTNKINALSRLINNIAKISLESHIQISKKFQKPLVLDLTSFAEDIRRTIIPKTTATKHHAKNIFIGFFPFLHSLLIIYKAGRRLRRHGNLLTECPQFRKQTMRADGKCPCCQHCAY